MSYFWKILLLVFCSLHLLECSEHVKHQVNISKIPLAFKNYNISKDSMKRVQSYSNNNHNNILPRHNMYQSPQKIISIYPMQKPKISAYKKIPKMNKYDITKLRRVPIAQNSQNNNNYNNYKFATKNNNYRPNSIVSKSTMYQRNLPKRSSMEANIDQLKLLTEKIAWGTSIDKMKISDELQKFQNWILNAPTLGKNEVDDLKGAVNWKNQEKSIELARCLNEDLDKMASLRKVEKISKQIAPIIKPNVTKISQNERKQRFLSFPYKFDQTNFNPYFGLNDIKKAEAESSEENSTDELENEDVFPNDAVNFEKYFKAYFVDEDKKDVSSESSSSEEQLNAKNNNLKNHNFSLDKKINNQDIKNMMGLLVASNEVFYYGG